MSRREEVVAGYRRKIAEGRPIIGGGAGIGMSAISAAEAGLDFIVVYNSGRYRMAGRSSIAGLMPYGDANAIVLEMAAEILPVAGDMPVVAGVCGTDPFRSMPRFLARIRDEGFTGVQNFPTVGLFEGMIRVNLEETGLGFDKEVEMIGEAHAMDLLTCAYVMSPDDAAAMARAGADIVVPHMGTTSSGKVGARTSMSFEEAIDRTRDLAEAARGENPDIIVLSHGGPIVGPAEAARLIAAVPGLHGFLGASSMERHPTELAMVEHMTAYTRITLPAPAERGANGGER